MTYVHSLPCEMKQHTQSENWCEDIPTVSLPFLDCQNKQETSNAHVSYLRPIFVLVAISQVCLLATTAFFSTCCPSSPSPYDRPLDTSLTSFISKIKTQLGYNEQCTRPDSYPYGADRRVGRHCKHRGMLSSVITLLTALK